MQKMSGHPIPKIPAKSGLNTMCVLERCWIRSFLFGQADLFDDAKKFVESLFHLINRKPFASPKNGFAILSQESHLRLVYTTSNRTMMPGNRLYRYMFFFVFFDPNVIFLLQIQPKIWCCFQCFR